MATIKVTGPAADEERKLTSEEAKQVLDARIRQRFRYAVRDMVRDDGAGASNFGEDKFTLVVQDIYDDVISDMRYDEVMRKAVRDGVKNFNTAYVTGVLKRAIKGKAVPNPGIIMSSADAVAELGEDERAQLTERLAKLGTGARFKKLAKEVGSKPLAAWIGRKKYGKERFQEMSRKGKKRSRKGKKRGSR
jgi:hypothetical protein